MQQVSSMGNFVPTPKATPATTNNSEALAFALLEATSSANLAAHYVRKGNIAAARRKAVQLLKSLQSLEVAHA